MSSWHIACTCLEYGLKRLLNTLLAVKCGSGCKCWIINYSFDSSQIDLGQYSVPLRTWTTYSEPMGGPYMEPNTQRWTAGKKTELVVSILKQDKTLVDACRENDLKQSEVRKWIEQFLEGGKRNLKVNSKDVMVQHRKEIEALHRKVGELVLENDILKKFNALHGE